MDNNVIEHAILIVFTQEVRHAMLILDRATFNKHPGDVSEEFRDLRTPITFIGAMMSADLLNKLFPLILDKKTLLST